jgi:hypothetical protein
LGIAITLLVPILVIGFVIRAYVARVARRSKAMKNRHPGAIVFIAFINPTWPVLLRHKSVSIGLIAIADNEGLSLTQGPRKAPVWSKPWAEIKSVEPHDLTIGKWPGAGVVVGVVDLPDGLRFSVSNPEKSGSRIAPADETEDLISRLNALRVGRAVASE